MVLLGVDPVAPVGCDGEQDGEVAWWQRPDDVQPGVGQMGEVRGTDLSCDEHDCRARTETTSDSHSRTGLCSRW